MGQLAPVGCESDSSPGRRHAYKNYPSLQPPAQLRLLLFRTSLPAKFFAPRPFPTTSDYFKMSYPGYGQPYGREYLHGAPVDADCDKLTSLQSLPRLKATDSILLPKANTLLKASILLKANTLRRANILLPKATIRLRVNTHHNTASTRRSKAAITNRRIRPQANILQLTNSHTVSRLRRKTMVRRLRLDNMDIINSLHTARLRQQATTDLLLELPAVRQPRRVWAMVAHSIFNGTAAEMPRLCGLP